MQVEKAVISLNILLAEHSVSTEPICLIHDH